MYVTFPAKWGTFNEKQLPGNKPFFFISSNAWESAFCADHVFVYLFISHTVKRQGIITEGSGVHA